MVRGGLTIASSVNERGDILPVFKTVNEVLSSSNTRITIPVNLGCRMNRRVAYGLLEVIVEARGESIDWKLKLEDINITRQFKPTAQINLGGNHSTLYKFSYDVTSILNTPNVLSKEWINLGVKHEGGSPFKIKTILLDIVYEDNDAQTEYVNYSGFLILEEGEVCNQQLKLKQRENVSSRIIVYSPRKTSFKIQAGSKQETINIELGDFEEIYLPIQEGLETISIINTGGAANAPLLLSNIIVYSNTVKEPVLEVEEVTHRKTSSGVRLGVSIVNKGESKPDKVIITVLRNGNPVSTIMEQNPELKPGSKLIKEIEIPPSVQGEELLVRVIWLKMARRWIKDYPLKIN